MGLPVRRGGRSTESDLDTLGRRSEETGRWVMWGGLANVGEVERTYGCAQVDEEKQINVLVCLQP
jgi:hypothetical protein